MTCQASDLHAPEPPAAAPPGIENRPMPESTCSDPNQTFCPICEHLYSPRELTRHHLVPKSRKGRITVPVCSHCHRQIHALYTEKELERQYGTLEKLLAADELQPWIKWVRRRKPTARIPVRSSRRKARR